MTRKLTTFMDWVAANANCLLTKGSYKELNLKAFCQMRLI